MARSDDDKKKQGGGTDVNSLRSSVDSFEPEGTIDEEK